MNVLEKCRVIKAHEKKDGSELTLKIGDVITVLKKGQYIWYGQLEETKGFFPSANVEPIDETNSDVKQGNPVPPIAVADKTNDHSSKPADAPVDLKMSKETFKEMEATAPLEDKRRLRPKSSGRPPSQGFIKEQLRRSTSNIDTLDDSDEESPEEHKNKDSGAPTGLAKISSISQLVLELKQKPHLKSLIQKETVTATTATTENSTDPPAWMKALPKKKMSITNVIKTPEDLDNAPPWIKEVQMRRQHKLSLRGDELLQKVGQEIQACEDGKMKQTKVEIQSFETHTANQTVTEEKRNIQTKSINLVASEVSSSKSNFTTGSRTTVHRYSFTEDGADKNVATPTKKIEFVWHDTEAPKEKRVTNSVPNVNATTSSVETTSKVVSLASHTDNNLNSVEPMSHTKEVTGNTENTKTPKEANLGLHVTGKTDISVIPELVKETITVSQPTVVKEISENKVVKGEIKATTNAETNISPYSANQLSTKEKEKTLASVELLLKKMEKFEAKSKENLAKIQTEIQNLQIAVQQQYQEVIADIEEMKSELSMLTETKNK